MTFFLIAISILLLIVGYSNYTTLKIIHKIINEVHMINREELEKGYKLDIQLLSEGKTIEECQNLKKACIMMDLRNVLLDKLLEKQMLIVFTFWSSYSSFKEFNDVVAILNIRMQN